jgi:hypothetical protein
MAADLHDAVLDNPDAPSRYVTPDGLVVWRASALGHCERRLVATARGEEAQPHPGWFQDILNEGKACETQIVALYEARNPGIVVADPQRTVELQVMDGVVVRGHIDGLLYQGSTRALFEAKKVRESGWDAFKRQGVEWQATYPWQVALYMHALELDDAVMVGGLLKKGEDRISDIHVHHLTNPPLPLKAIVKRVRELERILGAGLGAMEVKCHGRDYPCPFWKMHDEPEAPVDPETGEPDERLDADGEFTVPKERVREWSEVVAKFAADDLEVKKLASKIEYFEKAKKASAEKMRVMLGEMGGENAKVVSIGAEGRAKIKRTKYARKEYTVKAAEVDYFQVVPSQDKYKNKSNDKANDKANDKDDDK